MGTRGNERSKGRGISPKSIKLLRGTDTKLEAVFIARKEKNKDTKEI